MKRKNRIISTTSQHLVAGLLTAFILFLNTGKESLHNHEVDFREHDDCPVLIIDQILSSGVTTHFELSSNSIVEIFVFQPLELILSNSPLNNFHLRAPPIV